MQTFRAMTSVSAKNRQFFDLAFDLAYYIHVNRDVAFFIAEDALDALPSMLGRQQKNLKPTKHLRGFLKWGERTRPLRRTVGLTDLQMLQWLVYKQSESWELQTERGEGPYLPVEEDLIVRFIEHLVFTTVRRGSFYTTLAIGPILYQFDRRETRLFYDVLTQSDSARMKDTTYIGKQRLEMLERISRRFDHKVHTAVRPGGEKHFVARPITKDVINLVNESLMRFTPWQTTCVVRPGFDVSDIPEFYFASGGISDEESIEMNRIRTVLDPECFVRFSEGLAKYVRTLPDEDPDKACNYNFPEQRLTVPQFADFPTSTSRGDRFNPPNRTEEDYIRLGRTLDARAHRRKNFTALELSIFVDGRLSYSFDPKSEKTARSVIGCNASVIEVRGRDRISQVTLAILPIGNDQFLAATFLDSVTNSAGQTVSLQLTPVRDADGVVIGSELEVSYSECLFKFKLAIPWIVQDLRVWLLAKTSEHKAFGGFATGGTRLAKISLYAGLVVIVSAVIYWILLRPPSREVRVPGQDQPPIVSGNRNTPVASGTTAAPPEQPATTEKMNGRITPKEGSHQVARAIWNMNRDAALGSVSVEPTRTETQVLDLSRQQAKIVLSLPLYDGRGRKYSRYRFTLSSAKAPVWQQTLTAPRISLTGYAHIIDFSVSTQRLATTGHYFLRVDGQTKRGWHRVGQLVLSAKA